MFSTSLLDQKTHIQQSKTLSQSIIDKHKLTLAKTQKEIDDLIPEIIHWVKDIIQTPQIPALVEPLTEFINYYKASPSEKVVLNDKVQYYPFLIRRDQEREAHTRLLKPTGILLLIEMSQKLSQCSEEAIQSGQSKSIEDLNQIMEAFLKLVANRKKTNPILEDIRDDLEYLIYKSLSDSCIAAFISGLCAFIAGLIVFLFAIPLGAIALPLMKIIEMICTLCAEPSRIYRHEFPVPPIVLSLAIIFFAPTPLLLSGLILIGLLSTLVSIHTVAGPLMFNTGDIVAKTMRQFFFQPPKSHTDLREQVERFVTSKPDMYVKLLTSDKVKIRKEKEVKTNVHDVKSRNDYLSKIKESFLDDYVECVKRSRK